MSYHFVAIEREYGSGGTEVAQKLAKMCNIPCYGREILETVSKEIGIPIEQIQRYEEKATNNLLHSLSLVNQAGMLNANILSSEERIYLAEQKAIQQFAMAGFGIFLGHCAVEALRDKPGLLRVFILADPPDKKRRSIEAYGIRASEAESVMRRFDKKRANYYASNTNCVWNDPRNYEIVLNSSSFGIDGCVRILKGLLLPDE